MYIYLFFLNLIFFFLFLILLNNFFINKFYYPFKILDLINFVINITIFSIINFFYFGSNFMIISIIINFNFFYISFHVQNMVSTSPRTKIILNIFTKNKKVYTEKNIVENRLNRLQSNQQIFINKKIIQINKKKKL